MRDYCGQFSRKKIWMILSEMYLVEEAFPLWLQLFLHSMLRFDFKLFPCIIYSYRPNIEMIIATKKVAGILVGYGDGPSTGLSPVSKFPQQKYGLHKDSTYEWNPFVSLSSYIHNKLLGRRLVF